MKLIDTHLHFWDLANNINSWVLNQDDNQLLKKNYLPAELFKNDSLYGVVHIEAHDSRVSTLEEIKWLNDLMVNQPQIRYRHIAFADITLPIDEFSTHIDAIKQFPCVKGIRHILSYHPSYPYSPANEDLSRHPNIAANLSYLAENELMFDCQMYPFQVAKFLPAIIDTKVTCLVDHCALPMWDSQHDFYLWQQIIIELAKCNHVYLKLSGLDMFKAPDQFDEVIDFCLRHFPLQRMLYGSNYPVSSTGNYAGWYNYLSTKITDKSLKEQIFFRNAASLFNM